VPREARPNGRILHGQDTLEGADLALFPLPVREPAAKEKSGKVHEGSFIALAGGNVQVS